MAKKKRKIKEVNEPVESEVSFGKGVQHFEEPLFIISISAFIITVVRSFLGGGEIGLGLAGLLFLLALGSVYIIYLYFQSGKGDRYFFGIPALIFLTAVFAWNAAGSTAFTARDYTVYSLMFGLLSLFYVMAVHRILKPGQAVIIALFLSTLIIHLVPAFTPDYAPWSGRYLAALDPYYYYRHADTIVETGYTPEHETLLYPTDPPNSSRVPLLASVLMASLAIALKQFGLGLHDIAMLYPGVFAAFTVVVFYLLLRDLFSDMKPYNYAAAILGAFMLMLNPSFAAKAIATNCEDDALGMFLLVSSFLLFTLSLRRKSLIISLLAGFSFLLLRISWAGYAYAVTVFGIFGVLYAIVNFIHKRNCVEHIPYFVIPMFMTQLYPLILHARASSPEFVMPSQTFLLPFGGVLLASFILEMIRRRYLIEGIDPVGEGGNKIDELIQKYAFSIGVVLLLLTAYYLFFISSPDSFIRYAVNLVTGAKQTGIIGMTTAEQKELCSSFDSGCLMNLMNHFGLAVLFGMGMVPMLLYFMLFKRSLGATFVLTWSLPMLYGVIHKSQYQFTASVPIVALGATIGLVIALKKDDIQGLKIIPTILLLFTPMLFYLFIPNIAPFGGSNTMRMGASADRIYWDGTLQWLGEQPKNTVVLTWWDYGHWIAAISKRISILDNTKGNGFMVQDIARFHVVVENETDALKIARKYNATNVVIDYSMIGKSGAPHFIGTSGLGGYIPFKAIGVKIGCINGGGCINLMEGGGEDYAYTDVNRNGSMVIDLTGEYVINRIETRLWDLDDVSYRYRIEASTDGVNWTEVVDKTGGEWSGPQTDSFKDINARFVKITGTYASTGNEFRVFGVRIYNPRYEGSGLGYGQCGFTPGRSVITPQTELNDEGGFDKVSRLVFGCNIGITLIFEIRNGQYSASNVQVATPNGQLPWQAWRDNTGASILGVQSLREILGNALGYPDRYTNLDTFNTLVYVPKEGEYDFNKVMMTKLYLGKYLEEYQGAGMADLDIEKPEYFKLVEGFEGNKPDNSSFGYVRVYEIIYPEDVMDTSLNESDES